MRKRKLEAVEFLWKRKHFEERSWKRKQTRKRLTLYGAESGSKKYSIASTSLVYSNLLIICQGIPRPGYSEVVFLIFESNCHLLLPVEPLKSQR